MKRVIVPPPVTVGIEVLGDQQGRTVVRVFDPVVRPPNKPDQLKTFTFPDFFREIWLEDSVMGQDIEHVFAADRIGSRLSDLDKIVKTRWESELIVSQGTASITDPELWKDLELDLESGDYKIVIELVKKPSRGYNPQIAPKLVSFMKAMQDAKDVK
jgi:hypothetical protein